MPSDADDVSGVEAAESVYPESAALEHGAIVADHVLNKPDRLLEHGLAAPQVLDHAFPLGRLLPEPGVGVGQLGVHLDERILSFYSVLDLSLEFFRAAQGECLGDHRHEADDGGPRCQGRQQFDQAGQPVERA